MAERRRFKPGDPVETFTPDDYTAMAREVEGLISPAVVPPLDNAGGEAIRVNLPEGFYALLSGTSSPYSFAEKYGKPGGNWATRVRMGASNAYEINGVAGLNAKYAWLEPGYPGDYRFQWLGDNTPTIHPSPCVFTATILDACTSAPLSGATVSIADYMGVVACSGTTDGSGVYTCTLTTGIPAFPAVTATYGGCTYTGPIFCGTPLTLYQCVGSIDYQAIDDGGGDVPDITYLANPVTPGGTVASMTGGSPVGVAGEWSSTTAGTAVFCWFAPSQPPTGILAPLACQAAACPIGTISTGPIATPCVGGSGTGHSGNETYWETCQAVRCVICGTNPDFAPVYYRRSLWLAAPCCDCSFLPKSTCLTIPGPGEVLGSDAGNTLTLTWDETSWDGDCATYRCHGFEVDGFPMVWTTGCQGGNGAGGYCYSNGADGTLCRGAFVPYGSSRASVSIMPQCGGTCLATATYQNFWGSDCPNPDDPASCGFTTDPVTLLPVPYYPISPLYCGFIPTGDFPCVFYTAQFPMSFVFGNLYNPATDVPGQGIHACTPINWVNWNVPGSTPMDMCLDPIDNPIGSTPWTTSCSVNDCGSSSGMMMVRRTATRPGMLAPPRRLTRLP